MAVLFANPYSSEHTGFEFTSVDEFNEKLEAAGFEECTIEFLDGDNAEIDLFSACSIHAGNLEDWFDTVENLDETEQAALYYLTAYCDYDLESALRKLGEVPIFQGGALEYAEDYLQSTGALDGLPANLQGYFDVQSFANDLELSGDIVEFAFGGQDWVADSNF